MRDLTTHAAEVEVLSGLGRKGPACLRLRSAAGTWLLDAGFGPEAGDPFRREWLFGAERVFITHDHIDHIGGAAEVVAAGLPIHCTRQTARALPAGAQVHILPERGRTEVAGVTVTTGRNGHALGGVWLHFGLGEGLFYSGDWSEESDWFAFDPPPAAATALIDASYGTDDVPQSERRAQIGRWLDAQDARQVLFPVPPSGRAGELALMLLARGRGEAGEVSLDPACQAAIAAALEAGGLAPAARALAPLLGRPFDPAARYLLCDTPNADGGMAGRIVGEWRAAGRLGRDAAVLFTGHMTAPARAIAAQGGTFLRWNVHPPLSDQIRMLDRIGARRFVPLFCARPEAYPDLPRTGAVPALSGKVIV